MKKIKKSSPELWDNVWKQEKGKQENQDYLKKTSNEALTKKIVFILLKKYGSLKGLKIIEIGAGNGSVSGVLAKNGGSVTILDYSKNAIKTSKKFFKDNNIRAKFILGDAFNINKKLLSKFDVSLSFGTIEHYVGQERQEIIKVHFDVLNKGGVSFICVPNKYNLPYQVHRVLSEHFSRWVFGEEYPFSGQELKNSSKKYCKKSFLIGTYLFKDPFIISKRIRKLLKSEKRSCYKKEFGTPLDKFLAPAICLVGEK